MTKQEMTQLKNEFGKDLKIQDYVRTIDDYSYYFDVKKEITYKGIIVGSDIVDYDFVRQNILEVNA